MKTWIVDCGPTGSYPHLYWHVPGRWSWRVDLAVHFARESDAIRIRDAIKEPMIAVVPHECTDECVSKGRLKHRAATDTGITACGRMSMSLSVEDYASTSDEVTCPKCLESYP